MSFTDIFIILLSYLLGCFNTGFYYIQFIYKRDIRTVGSNVTGAYNVSKIGGKSGFVITFIGDALKGALTVLLCRWFQLDNTITMICILMVLVGHIFPIQLKFKGGKGLSTAFGAFLAFQPILIIFWLLTCIGLYSFVRKYTITCLFALSLLPLEMFIYDYSEQVVGFFFVFAILILFACRKNLKEYIDARAYQGGTSKKRDK